MSVPRGLFAAYSSPPPPRTLLQDNPTLLVAYWCTGCCLVLITMRILGRLIRVSMLHRDDKFMLLSVVPLLAHQAFQHLVLRNGTNNTAGTENMGEEELRRRRVGSGMVLGARVTYAAFLWSQKFCITEFYVRLTANFWERSYDIGLKAIRWSLLVTFLAAVISVFVGCQPAHKLWQVRPDPGPQCRSAFVPLISISALGIFMDVLLILSPIPAIVRSSFTTTKKIRLILTTFGLSVFCIAFAGYRVPAVIKDHGSQQYRSLLASFEILTATVVSNAIVINSFARGKGAKRRKFSGETGLEGGEGGMVRMSYWGSDDDLVRDVGGGRIFGVVPSQKGYGISNRHGQLAQLEPAVLKPVERRGNVPVWELKERGEDTPITPPTTPKLERDTTKLYDEGGFLGAGDESEDDMQPCTSVSSSKVGLRPGHRAKDGR